MIKIVIVEDNTTIREGLKLLINATDGFSCTDSYGDAYAFLDNLKIDKPDLVLMDIGLPGISGIKAVEKAKEIYPELNIIMLTVYEDAEKIFDALCAGATGYLLKKTPPAQILEAIKEAHSGGSPMSPTIARKVVNLFADQNKKKAPGDSDLSEREVQILQGLIKGNSYKMIADEIFVSIDTVRYHISKIYRKLHIHTKSEAVAYGIKKGIL